MNDWIEINLPWYHYDTNFPVQEPYPVLADRLFKELGVRQKDIRFPEKHHRAYYEEVEATRLKMYQDKKRRTYAEEEAWIDNKLAKSKNPSVIAVLEFKSKRALRDKVNAWYDVQPECIEVAAKNAAMMAAHKEQEAKKSFCGRGLNKAGTLIEYVKNDKPNQELIGNMNENGGVCDDCVAISSTDIVLRYRIVWTPNT